MHVRSCLDCQCSCSLVAFLSKLLYLKHSLRRSSSNTHTVNHSCRGPLSISEPRTRPAKIFLAFHHETNPSSLFSLVPSDNHPTTHVLEFPFASPKSRTMSDKGGKRLSADSEEPSRKKVKKMDGENGEKYNPYLAHMYDGEENGNGTEPSPNSPLAGMKRQHTTAAQAAKAEDNDSNPFTGRPHSQKYFQILEGRRNLPVHKQRYIISILTSAFQHWIGITNIFQTRVPQQVPFFSDPRLRR